MWQWNDAVISGSYRGLRGGSWGFDVSGLQSSCREGASQPTSEGFGVGFRVASVPEPSTAGLLALVGAGWIVWKRRKVTL